MSVKDFAPKYMAHLSLKSPTTERSGKPMRPIALLLTLIILPEEKFMQKNNACTAMSLPALQPA
jgi:hypothetical protein